MQQPHYEEILKKIKQLQQQLEHEIEALAAKKQAEFQYTLKKGQVIFTKNIRKLQQRYHVGILPYILRAKPSFILTAPIIYSVILPLLLLDLAVLIYQHTCFRVYGIPIVSRKDYIIIDRHHLSYLNGIEKINCMYCGYGNGLIAYTREVFARTEQYWCPIKHAKRSLDTHHYTGRFIDYGDAELYRKQLNKLRDKLKSLDR